MGGVSRGKVDDSDACSLVIVSVAMMARALLQYNDIESFRSFDVAEKFC